jgi:hypothetical protein
MMQDVNDKSNSGVSWRKKKKKRKRNFSPEKMDLKFEEEASNMLFLD